MRRQVLDSLVAQGSLVGVVTSGKRDPEQILHSFAHSLCGSAPFFFARYSAVEGSAREFLSRVKGRLEKGGYAFIVFKDSIDGEAAKLLGSMRMTLVLSDEAAQDSDLFSDLEAQAPFAPGFFWWVGPLPPKHRFVHLYKMAKSSSIRECPAIGFLETNGEDCAKFFRALLKEKILRENPLEGAPRAFRKLFLPLCVLAAVLPFLYSTELVSNPAMFRNIKAEKSLYSDAPYFDFTFDGAEPLERIARYAEGRFIAVVTSEATLSSYVTETLERNGFPQDAWKKDRLHIPPEGTSIRFFAPENAVNPQYDSIAPAWKYFTRIIADSIAYVTELYHPKAVGKQRQHLAWDVASRSGARILAPFSGKAWTFRDERGGTVIGIADKKRVILFMHCDQLLYLDGQNVMQGDPVATVGMTGHTTGPHVHLVTGLVSKTGAKTLGGIRYTIVNPVTWFYQND